MAHARNVKVPFALPIQVLLAQIPMPAFQEDCEKAQPNFFAQFGHVRRRSVESLMVDRNGQTLNSQRASINLSLRQGCYHCARWLREFGVVRRVLRKPGRGESEF